MRISGRSALRRRRQCRGCGLELAIVTRLSCVNVITWSISRPARGLQSRFVREETMFEKSLSDLVRGIRAHKGQEVKRNLVLSLSLKYLFGIWFHGQPYNRSLSDAHSFLTWFALQLINTFFTLAACMCTSVPLVLFPDRLCAGPVWKVGGRGRRKGLINGLASRHNWES